MRSKCSLSNKLRSSNSQSNGMRFVFFHIKFMHIGFFGRSFVRCTASVHGIFYYCRCCCCCTQNALDSQQISRCAHFTFYSNETCIQQSNVTSCFNLVWISMHLSFIIWLWFARELLEMQSSTIEHDVERERGRHGTRRSKKVRIIKYPSIVSNAAIIFRSVL